MNKSAMLITEENMRLVQTTEGALVAEGQVDPRNPNHQDLLLYQITHNFTKDMINIKDQSTFVKVDQSRSKPSSNQNSFLLSRSQKLINSDILDDSISEHDRRQRSADIKTLKSSDLIGPDADNESI